MDREFITKVMSGAAGILSILAIILLLYIVVCNVFFNKDGKTEKLFVKTKATLPMVMGLAMLLINQIISFTQHDGHFFKSSSGFYSLLPVDNSLFSYWNIFLCLVSVGCLVAGSLIMGSINKRYGTLFCLNTALSLMIMPHVYSIVAFMWALGFWAIKRKMYWIVPIAVAIGLSVHLPVQSFDYGELVMLAYLILIPFMAKLKKEYYKILTVGLSTACGIFAIFYQVILR